MRNELRITSTETGEVETDLTGAKGSVGDLRKLLQDLSGKLGPIAKERHIPGHNHHHDGLQEHITGG